MRLCKSLNSGFTKPFNGFCGIFFYTIAVVIRNPKIKLSFRKSLIGRLVVIYSSLFIVFFYTIAVFIAKPKHTLRLCKSLMGGFAEPYDGFR